MKFLFDLDGTITKDETLPIIAKHFGVEGQIEDLTLKTIQGNVPFIESFICRVNILSQFPISEISDLLYTKVNFYTELAHFIKQHKNNCVVVTGNLSCWCDTMISKLGCPFFCSIAVTDNDKIVKLDTILRKESVVDLYKAQGEKVVFIGDGNNDLEAMRHADISIATGITHKPAKSLYSVVDYIIFDEKTLCRQLNQLL